MSVLIWIQTVYFFWKRFEKKSADNKKAWKNIQHAKSKGNNKNFKFLDEKKQFF